MRLVGQHRCTVLFAVNTSDIQWTFPRGTLDGKLREGTSTSTQRWLLYSCTDPRFLPLTPHAGLWVGTPSPPGRLGGMSAARACGVGAVGGVRGERTRAFGPRGVGIPVRERGETKPAKSLLGKPTALKIKIIVKSPRTKKGACVSVERARSE